MKGPGGGPLEGMGPSGAKAITSRPCITVPLFPRPPLGGPPSSLGRIGWTKLIELNQHRRLFATLGATQDELFQLTRMVWAKQHRASGVTSPDGVRHKIICSSASKANTVAT